MKPWRTIGGNGLPQNLDGRNYSGINTLVLLLTGELNGYVTNRWGTFKAIKDKGGSVRKGKKATPAFFYKSRLIEKKDENGGVVRDNEGKPVMNNVYLLRYYSLFNLSQTTIKTDAEPEENSIETKFPELAVLVDKSKALIEHGFDKACYVGRSDRIRMSALKQFKSEENYWATLLHELVHWTGHETRLNRFKQFSYPTGELVAELGASFLCAEFNIDGSFQHSEYIHHCIKEMEEDCKFVLYGRPTSDEKV